MEDETFQMSKAGRVVRRRANNSSVAQDVTANGETAFAAFRRFSRFFCELFSEPGLLDGAECRQSYKEYIPRYYSQLFGPHINPLSPRHLKWYRRLEPLFSLPKKSCILDYGGGYGMDAIFLASLGYEVVFYEITRHHIGAARWFAERFGERFGPIAIDFVLAGENADPCDLDAVFLDEVAHHVEPPQRAFLAAAAMVRPGGHLFLLEPNFFCPLVQAAFFKIRGIRTVQWRVNENTGQKYLWGNEHIRPVPVWDRFARAAGFRRSRANFVIPWFLRDPKPLPSALRRGLERLPVVRDVLASHVTLDYVLVEAPPARGANTGNG